MRAGRQKQGYTVVEVLLFMVISGFMFIVAANFISGKQAKNEFKQGMDDINSQIRQVANDVSNGFYPPSTFACSAGGTLASPLTFPGGTAPDQGSNQGCVFIGKVMQFGVGDPNGTNYNVYSVVGRQFQTNSSNLLPPSNFHEAQPVAMTGNGGTPDLIDNNTLKWGLRPEKITSNGVPIGAFGFFAGFSSTEAGNKLESGAAAPVTVAFRDSALGGTSTNGYNWVRDLGDSSPDVDTNPTIIMCFSGSADQFGRLTIGTSGQRLATSVQISTGSPTAGCT